MQREGGEKKGGIEIKSQEGKLQTDGMLKFG